MANFKKWTYENRKLLYTLLKERFGAYSTWENRESPSKEKRPEFLQFCEAFAQYITLFSGAETTPDAVRQQLAWAVTPQGEVKDGNVSSFIGNVYVAYDVGFLSNSDLPEYLLVDRKIQYDLPTEE